MSNQPAPNDHQTPSGQDLRDRVAGIFPDLLHELAELVAIPSVSSDPDHVVDVAASAEHVRDRFAAAGLSAECLHGENPDGTPGRPAVVARTPAVEGAPTVLLYAHHDVQPTGDVARWTSDPFVAEVRGERIYGRGASDDGAGIIVHLGALRALGPDLPVNVVVYIEGEEEVGSPSFRDFVTTHAERLRADVIVVADSHNWKVGEPALTTTLRGNCTATVDVKVLGHAVHSGAFGGPVLDAVTLAARLIATLHDEAGDVAVRGLGGESTAEVVWPEDEFRAAAGTVAGLRLAGTGDLAARVWTKPAINVIGFDARPVAQASNTIAPDARFKLSMRTVPGHDPREDMEALRAHLEQHVPFGAEVTVTPNEYGPGYRADLTSPVADDLHRSLEEAWGVPAVNIGVGGSIPFISDFQEVFPDAQVVVTGVEDPQTNAHSEDESQSVPDLEAAVLAEALLLVRLGRDD
ncbi:M20/M25/M40 family metallo-hydrolase [Actinomyces polynesiensis]|uniref:M20/M25/M40 family metallo-hydrolase n=1 Tax=Actinomyces polynesiensis TaxID=1325934 RepID=UPI0006947580|nr:M20/M25/M40 family metallo-hydrolase [Actinomyces polynesiensis]